MLNFTLCKRLIALFLLLIPFVSAAQSHAHSWECGSDLILERAQQNPDWLNKHQRSEQRIYDFFTSRTAPIAGKRMMVVTLPVVVHIVHDNGSENISDAQVVNGIQQLNEAFANSAYYDQETGTNTMIQFCLAQRTPDDLATSGITRNQDPLTEVTIETEDLDLKNLNRWTPTDYINIWLVREICSSGSGCGVAGYAYLPTSHGNPEDGIVMEATYMGATPAGTGVLAHEMGHYLGLYHTFQGGCANDDCLVDGDRVCDTPPDQSTLWVSCNSNVNTCTTDAQSGFSSDQPDMILNFMDYTDFACFNDFTPGQSDRMNWHIENIRFSLLDSKGCLNPCPNPITATFTASAALVNVGQTVNFTNGSTNASAYTWTINGVPFSNAVNPAYTFTTAGTFSIVMTASSNNPALCNPRVFTRIIEVICPVIADFDASNLNPVIGEAVTITNQSQNATQYEWFLEGVSQGATFSGFTPDASGVYVVKLVAGNGFCQKTKVIYVAVQDSCTNFSFQKTWGGPEDDRGSRTTTLADGNFLVAGTTIVSGETNIFLLKAGTDGATIWQRSFGLPGVEQVGNLLALPDGGWILLGNRTFVAGNTHPFLARFSANGTVLWQREINTPAAVNIFTTAIRTQDGNLLVGGAINDPNALSYAAYLAKITLDGTVLWSNIYDGGNTDWIGGLLELPNGDIVATGFTLSFGLNSASIHDGMVMRLTSTGTLQWVNAYGSVDNEGFSSIFLTPDGNLMTMGSTSGWNGPGGGQFKDDSWMVKLAQNGALLWSGVFRTNFDLDLASRSVYQSSDSGFVIAANDLGASGTNFNSFFFKTSPDGDLEWSRMYTPTTNNKITSVNGAPDGYIFTGYTDVSGNEEIWFLRADEAGFAGICPETPHQANTLTVQPTVTPGQLSTLAAPGMVVSNLALNDIVPEEDELCPPDCIEDGDCEDTWIKTLGIPGVVEGANNLIPSNDGNFYLSGYRGDSTLLAKMTPEGLVLWTRTFKFTSGTLENISQLIEDSDGNLVGAGLFNASPYRAFSFKYNPSTDQVVWAYESPANPQTFYIALLERQPGGNYWASVSYYNSPAPGNGEDANLVEIDRNTGAHSGLKWAYSLATGSFESVNEMQIRNGNLYTTGRYTYGAFDSGMRGSVSKFDLSGNEIWSRMALVGPGAQAKIYAPDFVFDGDNMVTVYYGDFSNDIGLTNQFAVSKSDLDGNLIWSRLYTLPGTPQLFVQSILSVPDGYVIYAPNTAPNQTGSVYLIKIDKNGNVLWAKDYPNMEVFHGEKFLATANEYLYFAASHQLGDIAIAKLRLSDGIVGGACEFPLDVLVTAQTMAPVFNPVSLVRYTAPITHSTRVATPRAGSLTSVNHCMIACSPEDCEDTWIKTLGIPGVVEGANNLIRATDGNFYLSGYRGDSTLLAKMTPEGLVLWTRTFKFTSGTLENISQIIEDSEGNLVGCGLFTSNQFRGFTFKYDPSSDQVLWAFENPATPQSLYFAILEMAPGGNYLAFNSYHNSPAPGSQDDADMVEINRNTGQYTGIDQAFSFGSSEGVIEAQRHNGFIYTSGRYTYGNNLSGMRGGISCFDLSGNEIWSRMPFFGPSVPARNYGTDFVFDSDNMVTIYYGDFMGADAFTEQFAVSKTDLNGNMSWARLYTLDGFPEVYVKSIITVPDGYVIFATNRKIDQPASVFLIKIDKNGAVLWARDYRDMLVVHGEKFLATANGYLYFTASYGAGDIVFAKVQLSDGLVGTDCGWPLELVVSVEDLPLVFNPINLVNYPAPITQNTRVAVPSDRSLPLTNLCLASCFPEICNNGLDDDGDGLFDCLDPECDCSSCDGEQARIWYFGNKAGLDFSTDPPTVLSDGASFTYEATSMATDLMGNLLFYTDASRLFNRNHVVMPNGNNLNGHVSSSQTLILPQPDKPWRFFVFTPNSQDNLGTGNGLSYSIVNMSLDGSLGDVEPGQKNIELIPQSQYTEKITATRHCNGKDWWIVVKERNNNTFRAYPLTAAGLGAPVLSSGGTPGSAAIPNVISCLKFSPNGKKIANALAQSGGFDLFDFDQSTGLLSNPVTVTSPAMMGAYGVEFSSDGTLLYLTNLTSPAQLWQFDLTGGNAGAILQSAVVLASSMQPSSFGQLQRAPNGKIYLTNSGYLQFTSTLGVIHQPDEQGTACLYQQAGQNIAPGSSNLSVPSFPQDFLPKRLFVAIEGPDSLCQTPATQTFNLNISDRCALDSVRWTLIGAGSIASQSDEAITLNFDQAGIATLVARAYSKCFDGVDTLRIEVFENNTPVLDLGPDVQTCDNGVEVLDAGPGFREYRWNDGSTESTLTTLFPGTYWVDVWDACGNHQSDTIDISVLPATVLDLGDDRNVCSSSTLTYTLPPSFTSWTWAPETGLDCSDCNTVNIAAGDTITYIVVASNGENCLSADTLTIFYRSDTVYASLDTVVCTGETLLLFGQEIPADTVVAFYSMSAGGCDSVLTVTVTGLDPAQTLVQESICPGDTLNFNGINITRDTAFQFLLTGANGCDSLVLVEVNVLEPPTGSVTLQACPGAVATYGGVPIPAGTTQVVTVPGVPGTCDSLITVTVAVYPPPIVQLPATDTVAAGLAIQLNPSVIGTGPFLWQWGPAAPPELLSCYPCPDPFATPLSATLFTVTVTDANGCEGVDSIALFVKPCGQPYVPNAFSPNGDGINDWFYLQSSECEVHIRYLRVFGRWGELIFQRNDFAPNIATLGWDGRFRGREMGANVFVWVAEIEFPDGTILLKKGDVTLLR